MNNIVLNVVCSLTKVVKVKIALGGELSKVYVVGNSL